MNPFALLSGGEGGLGLDFGRSSSSSAASYGDINQRFGNSAPGISTGQIAFIGAIVLGGLLIWKKVK